jgi:hypothetical protein
VILDDIPVRLAEDGLFKRLRVGGDSPQAAELRGLIREAESIARPKALCGVAYIDDRGDNYVVVDGVRFSSRVLAANLKGTHRVFPYLATCGTELEGWANGLEDVLQRYWSEAIREAVMRGAMAAVQDYLQATFRPGETSRMNPGSLADWPIEEQGPLFRLLGDTESTVGVRLTDSFLMVPTKTVSGVWFGGSGSFESCMLCPRPSCPNRRAPHDPALYERRYSKGTA